MVGGGTGFLHLLSDPLQHVFWRTEIIRNNILIWGTVGLFDLILYVPSSIFLLNRDGASWVEPVLS